MSRDLARVEVAVDRHLVELEVIVGLELERPQRTAAAAVSPLHHGLQGLPSRSASVVTEPRPPGGR